MNLSRKMSTDGVLSLPQKITVVGLTLFFISQIGMWSDSNAYAMVAGTVKITKCNSIHVNNGKISATQQTYAGAATQRVGLQANAPTVAWTYEYTEEGCSFTNNGEIKANQTTVSGAAEQTVALSVN